MIIFIVIVAIVTLGWFVRSGLLVRRAVLANRQARLITKPFHVNLKQPSQHFLVMGDSTMYGSGVKKPENTFGGLLAGTFPKANVETVARSGSLVENLTGQLAAAKFRRYDLAIIGIGGNDIVYLADYKKVEIQLQAFLKEVSSRSDHIILFHSVNVGNTGFFLWPLSLFYQKRTKKLSQIYTKIAKEFESVQYVNFYRHRKNDYYDKKTRPRFIADDGFHPSDYGNQYFFKLLRQQTNLDQLFKDKKA